jgi:hypothetical protein
VEQEATCTLVLVAVEVVELVQQVKMQAIIYQPMLMIQALVVMESVV